MAWPPASTGNIQLKVNGLGWGSVENLPLANYAIGVPHPQNFFGYDPLTIARPADPAEWPSAENSLFYYIDNSDVAATDTANTYGYPDKPRLTVPEGTFPAGTVMVVKGTNYTIGGDGRWEMTFQGTQQNPCFFMCEDVTATVFLKEIRNVGGSHVIYDNLTFNVDRQTLKTQQACTYVTLRNSFFTGPGVNSGNTSVVSVSGTDNDNRSEYIVWYNNDVHDWGNYQDVAENDYHAFLPGQYSSYVWCIGNTSYQNGGDSIQVGQASYTGLQRPDHVYIAKNDFHDDRENAFDIKGAIDVIVSENEGYNYVNQNSSSGEIAIIHDDNEYVWFLNNKLHDGRFGISFTSGSNFYALGNEIRDMSGTPDFPNPYFEPNTGIYITSGGPFELAHNTVNNTIIGYASHNGSTLTNSDVSGNIFGERQDIPQGWDFMGESSGNASLLSADYNVYDSFRGRIAGTDYSDLTSWQAATVYDDNSVDSDPLFTNAVLDDFTLQAGSPAIGIVATEVAAYALFESRYGLDIRFDINGNAKPTTNADAGAYQRAA